MRLDSPSRFTSFYESFSDLVFGTMAIFVLLMLVFLALVKPSENTEELKKKLEEASQENQTLSEQNDAFQRQNIELEKKCGDLEQTRAELQSCQEKIDKKFLLVVISWPGRNDDIDLHVVDPNGREYYYSKKTHEGSPAALEEDSTKGPGNEIWLHPQAAPGTYRVYYKYFRKASRGTAVRGVVLYPEGKHQLRNINMTVQGRKTLIAELHIDQDGVLSVTNSQ